ncbi:kinase-like domain-containing protein [Xylaria telfairii]|nr:kinase-like domain-containing protein [Xylaria telfairii]
MLDNLLDLGFSDYMFPVTGESVPRCLRPSQRSEFLEVQKLIMTQSMDLERGQHCSFQQGDPIPFKTQKVLGAGSSGQVDQVMSLISFKTYARKRILRRKANTGRTPEAMRQFVVEIQTLKRLEHNHVVEFVGSYTDPKYIGLIMSPVAEMDLATYLDRTNGGGHGELRTFFGCLVKALEYLHENKVRHKDIKPQNILVDRGRVLFTDFGLAFDFTNADRSTTFNTVIGFTPRYCAPEVAMMDSRNTSSDIWSLGVVFLEMAAVLKGMTVNDIYEFFKTHGSRQEFVRTNPVALSEFVAELERRGSSLDNKPLQWVRQMLETDQQSRPTSYQLSARIFDTDGRDEGNAAFCGICCSASDSDDDSDDDRYYGSDYNG